MFHCQKCNIDFEFSKKAHIFYDGIYCPECWEKELEKSQKEKSKFDSWEYKKKYMSKFKPYFNSSLGIKIESKEQLKQLEKDGTIFMDIDEYQREGKKIKAEKTRIKNERLKKNIKEKIEKVKSGYSFHTAG